MEKKVVLITGASSGIGFDCAKELLKKGMIVYGAARRVERMKELEKLGGKALYMDVRDQETVNKAVEAVIGEQQRIDVLFANAGYVQQGPVECVDIEDAKKQYDTNVFGCIRTIKAVLPYMRKQKGGRILVTSSAVASVTMPGMAWYPSTKHALDALIGGLRIEMKDFGIGVSIIEPGYVNTEIVKPALKYSKKIEQTVSDRIYRKQIKAVRKNFTRSTRNGEDVSVISKLVIKAITDNKPKRYYCANQAKLLKGLKRIFGYSLLDPYMRRSLIK